MIRLLLGSLLASSAVLTGAPAFKVPQWPAPREGCGAALFWPAKDGDGGTCVSKHVPCVLPDGGGGRQWLTADGGTPCEFKRPVAGVGLGPPRDAGR